MTPPHLIVVRSYQIGVWLYSIATTECFDKLPCQVMQQASEHKHTVSRQRCPATLNSKSLQSLPIFVFVAAGGAARISY